MLRLKMWLQCRLLLQCLDDTADRIIEEAYRWGLEEEEGEQEEEQKEKEDEILG